MTDELEEIIHRLERLPPELASALAAALTERNSRCPTVEPRWLARKERLDGRDKDIRRLSAFYEGSIRERAEAMAADLARVSSATIIKSEESNQKLNLLRAILSANGNSPLGGPHLRTILTGARSAKK